MFKIQIRKGEFYKQWRQNVFQIVKHHREDIDEAWIQSMNKGRKWICSLHYKEEDIERTGKSSSHYQTLITLPLHSI